MFWSREEMIQTGYQVIFECWSHKNTLTGKMKYAAAFTPEEQDELADLYKKFYGWVIGFGAGTPAEFECSIETRQLIIRAANFFKEL